MISFEEGLETLPRRLAEVIGDVRTAHPVTRIARAGDGFRLQTPAGAVEAREVVVATPADAAAEMLAELSGGAGRAFAEIPYSPVAVVSLGFRRRDVAHPLDGFGFLVPRGESLRILGCLFPSTLFTGRAPEGHVALSAFLGGRTDPEVVGWDDERLLGRVLGDLGRAVGLSGGPVTVVIRRWPRAIPQYELGHGRFVELAARLERDHPGLCLGGNFLRGISVPDCIENGTEVARGILAC
jgi:oxygen-dependent protoporphyrinogen oxidase